ncbi:MAG TPA: serine/threonine-protein kinase, partial [Myxococcales bacterium]
PDPKTQHGTSTCEPTLPSSGAKTSAIAPLARGSSVGRYLVLDLIGEGGMGAVYSAYDPDLGRKVAIKLVKLSGQDPGQARARLVREAQAMARVSDPNVLAVFDAGELGDEFFMAMELVDGASLWAWQKQASRSRREILKAYLAAGAGLWAAHREGLVHRDFKPENVLVGKDGRVRVADFGLAHSDPCAGPPLDELPPTNCSVQAATIAGAVCGTPAYMAPEQFLGEATDARTDQFSFCAAMWEALAGQAPFGGDDFASLRKHVLAGELLPPVLPLTRRQRSALARGLSRDPQDRFGDMGELLAILRYDWTRQAGRIAGWVVAAVAAGALGLGALALHYDRTRCEREADSAAQAAWNPSRRAAVAESLGTSGLAPASVEQALAVLDADSEEWKQSQRSACLNRRDGGPSAQGAGRCLERHALRVGTTIANLSQPSPRLVELAGPALEQLGHAADCLAPRSAPLPDSPEVSALRGSLESAAWALDLGRSAEVVESSRALRESARRLGARAEAARAGLLLAKALHQTEGLGQVLETLRAAVRDADAGDDDALMVESRITLGGYLAIEFARSAEAEQVALDADAVLERIRRPPRLELDLVDLRAVLAANAGRTEESLELFRRAAATARQAFGQNSGHEAFELARLATALARAGRLAESAEAFERSLRASESARFEQPASHANAWINLAQVRYRQGKPTEALECTDRAAATLAAGKATSAPALLRIDLVRASAFEAQAKLEEAGRLYEQLVARSEKQSPALGARALCGWARTLAARGRAREALDAATRASASVPQGDHYLAGLCAFSMAQARWALGQHEEARAEASSALTRFGGPEESFHREWIGRWLGERGTGSR